MKILSWNILANEFIKQSYYPMIPSHILLNRKKRQDSIIETLKHANADIMFLQEVMQSEYNKLDDEFNKTYHLIKGKHIYWDNIRCYSGNIILLRKSLFSLPTNQVDLSFGLAIQVHLQLCTIKSPSSSAFIGSKGNSYHALEKCEGVKEKIELPILLVNVHLDDLSQANRLRQIKKLEPLLFSQPRIILSGDLNEHYNSKHITKLYKAFEEDYFTITNHEPTYYIKSKICIDNILLKGFETHTKPSKVINEFGANVVEHFANYGSDHLPVTVTL